MEKLLTKNNIKYFIFILIFIVGFFLRFYQLGQVPSSLNRDEPAIGYNAFSLLKTGKDEWGEKFPLSFKSFGDYKSPLYIYLTTLSIAFFGLNEFSVRFWGALSGSILLIVMYLFTKNLVNCKDKNIYVLAVTFTSAIVPWAIFYSRFSFEANLALTLNLTIIYLLSKDNFKKISPLVTVLILLSLLTYSSSLIIWPLYMIFLSFYFLKQNFSFKGLMKVIIMLLLLGIVAYNQSSISEQKSHVTIFNNPQLRLDYNQQRTWIAEKNLLQAKLFYNQYLYFGNIFLKNYLKTFSLNFFFGGGGEHPWHKTPYQPHFYPSFVLLITIGIGVFIKSSIINKRTKILLGLFCLLAPIPSAITIDTPHATRLLNLFVFMNLFAGLGLGWLYSKKRIIGVAIVFLLLINLCQFLKYYFLDYKQNPPTAILPGLKEAILVMEKEKLSADRIIIDNNSEGGYAYLLFYSQYSPIDFITSVKRRPPDTIGLEYAEKFDKYIFAINPTPNPSYKEIYLLRGENSLNQKVITQIKNQYNGEIYYTIAANF